MSSFLSISIELTVEENILRILSESSLTKGARFWNPLFPSKIIGPAGRRCLPSVGCSTSCQKLISFRLFELINSLGDMIFVKGVRCFWAVSKISFER